MWVKIEVLEPIKEAIMRVSDIVRLSISKDDEYFCTYLKRGEESGYMISQETYDSLKRLLFGLDKEK